MRVKWDTSRTCLAFFSFMPSACAMSATEGDCPLADVGLSWRSANLRTCVCMYGNVNGA